MPRFYSRNVLRVDSMSQIVVSSLYLLLRATSISCYLIDLKVRIFIRMRVLYAPFFIVA